MSYVNFISKSFLCLLFKENVKEKRNWCDSNFFHCLLTKYDSNPYPHQFKKRDPGPHHIVPNPPRAQSKQLLLILCTKNVLTNVFIISIIVNSRFLSRYSISLFFSGESHCETARLPRTVTRQPRLRRGHRCPPAVTIPSVRMLTSCCCSIAATTAAVHPSPRPMWASAPSGSPSCSAWSRCP